MCQTTDALTSNSSCPSIGTWVTNNFAYKGSEYNGNSPMGIRQYNLLNCRLNIVFSNCVCDRSVNNSGYWKLFKNWFKANF